MKTKRRGAPQGNEFWRLVKEPTGRPKKFTPAGLWKEAQRYFAWVSKHPLKEQKVFGTRYKTSVNKLRPMTETGFCLFAGIDDNTFIRYKTGEDYKDYWEISNIISRIIYQQKFEGATVDLFNPNIIARDLGLKDNQRFEFDYERMPEKLLDQIIQANIDLIKKNIQ